MIGICYFVKLIQILDLEILRIVYLFESGRVVKVGVNYLILRAFEVFNHPEQFVLISIESVWQQVRFQRFIPISHIEHASKHKSDSVVDIVPFKALSHDVKLREKFVGMASDRVQVYGAHSHHHTKH